MSEPPFYAPNLPPAPPRQATTGELLFEFIIDHDRYRFELRNHGPDLGIECQIWKNEDFLIGRRFDPRLDRSRPSREMAIAWANEERAALEH